MACAWDRPFGVHPLSVHSILSKWREAAADGCFACSLLHLPGEQRGKALISKAAIQI